MMICTRVCICGVLCVRFLLDDWRFASGSIFFSLLFLFIPLCKYVFIINPSTFSFLQKKKSPTPFVGSTWLVKDPLELQTHDFASLSRHKQMSKGNTGSKKKQTLGLENAASAVVKGAWISPNPVRDYACRRRQSQAMEAICWMMKLTRA